MSQQLAQMAPQLYFAAAAEQVCIVKEYVL